MSRSALSSSSHSIPSCLVVPYACLTLFLVLVPFQAPHSLFTPLLTLSFLALALVLLCFRPPFPGMSAPCLLLLIFFNLVGFWRMDAAACYEAPAFLLFTQAACFILGAVLLREESNRRLFLSLHAALLVAVSLYALLQYFWVFPSLKAHYFQEGASAGGELPFMIRRVLNIRLKTSRPSAMFSNPNLLSGYLLLSVPLFVPRLAKKRPFPKTALFGLLPLSVILLTESLSGIMLLAAGFLLCVFFKTPGKRFVFLAACTALVFFAAAFGGFAGKRLPPSLRSRLNYWNTAGKIIRGHPVAGTGLGSFRHEFLKRLPVNEEVTRYAHNHFVETASEKGIPASAGIWLLYCLLLSGAFVRDENAPRSLHRSAAAENRMVLFAALAVTAVAAYFCVFIIYPFEYSFLFSVGMGTAVCMLALFFISRLRSGPSPMMRFALVGGILFFLQGLVDISLEKMALGGLFWIFLGVLSSGGKKRLSGKTLRAVSLFLGVFFAAGIMLCLSTLAARIFLGEAKKHFRAKRFDRAERSLVAAFRSAPFATESALALWKFRIEQALHADPVEAERTIRELFRFPKGITRGYVPWFYLAKRIFTENEQRLFPWGLAAADRALECAPAHQGIRLLKARYLEQTGRSERARSLYADILKKDSRESWNDYFGLTRNERRFLETRLDGARRSSTDAAPPGSLQRFQPAKHEVRDVPRTAQPPLQ